MSTDTISTDPKMKEEARRMASESAFPKLPYDPKAVAREEFERVVDQRFNEKTFEETWKSLTEAPSQAPAPPTDDLYGVLQETEFRQLLSSIFYGLNSINLAEAARKQHERGEVLHKAAQFTINDRLDIEKKKIEATYTDLLHGILRKPIQEPRRACMIHPNGCPDEDDPRGALARAILGAIIGRSK
jgi:hypothetical protein